MPKVPGTYQAVQYIGKNGEKSDLKEGGYRWWICPEWCAAGWGFVGTGEVMSFLRRERFSGGALPSGR